MSKVVCTICARSGSRGVVDKNIRMLKGRPLLLHSIQAAVDAKIFDKIIFTSDSESYLDIASCDEIELVKRPVELSRDNVNKLGAIEHAVSVMEAQLDEEFDIIVDLDVTSPLRLADDIIGALEFFKKNNPSSVITGCLSHRSPYSNLVEVNESGVVQVCKKGDKIISRRQEAPICYDMNASIYIWNRKAFHKDPKVFYDDTLLYEMPFERSWDIDNEIDFLIVETLYSDKSR